MTLPTPGSRWRGASGTTFIVQEIAHEQVWGMSESGTPWNELVVMVPKLYRPLTTPATIGPDDSQSSPVSAEAKTTTTTGVDMTEKEKAAYAAERDAWIAKLGSRRLRLAAERGYKVDGLYIDERLAAEMPGVKRLRRPKIKDIVSPSEEALDLETVFMEKGYDCGLVFVTDSDDADRGEALVIRNYLGKGDVYCMIEEDEA